jgi:hypothetical protein
MTIESPNRTPMPRTLVLAFMAGLSWAVGRSARLYVDELMSTLAIVRAEGRA